MQRLLAAAHLGRYIALTLEYLNQSMKVTIVEYRPEWQRLFEREKELLQNVLGRDTTIIEHIGSTSVIGLAAKSIIDIMVGLHEFSIANSLVPKIKALGYDYIPEYEDTLPYRRFFSKKVQETATHHIHMVEIGSEFWERHLLFRNYLRENPQVAKEYASLKKELAEREWLDTNEYADAKTEFIRSIEKAARSFEG